MIVLNIYQYNLLSSYFDSFLKNYIEKDYFDSSGQVTGLYDQYPIKWSLRSVSDQMAFTISIRSNGLYDQYPIK